MFAGRQSPVMVPTHQHDVGLQALIERLQIRPQAFGQPEGTMDQIAQDDQPGGLPRGTERFQSPEGFSITVTGERNPAGLKHLGFSEMQVSNE